MSSDRNRYNVWKVVYQLKISLCIDEDDEFEPKIWRQIQIPQNFTLSQLNLVVQVAMGWIHNLPHRFVVKNSQFNSMANYERIGDGYCVVENEDVLVAKYLNLVEKHVYYYYNFLGLHKNYYWDHEIVLETLLPYEIGVKYPRCIVGERCVPPDRCGGPEQFKRLVDNLIDPHNIEYDETIKRFGWFDPDGFDVESVNSALDCLFM